MSFTDNELGVLKAMCANGWPIDGKQLLPLLARLEAAEKALHLFRSDTEHRFTPDQVEASLAWRKAAGRAQE